MNVVMLPQGAPLWGLNSLQIIVNWKGGQQGTGIQRWGANLWSRGGAGPSDLSADTRSNTHLTWVLIFFSFKVTL